MGPDKESGAEGQADLYFGSFRLERVKRLWRGAHLVDVRPRSLAVLRYLAERAGRVVTSDELFSQLWPGIYVTRTVLRVCIRELRQALQDEAGTPSFIETMGRQGYRFIAPVTTTAAPGARAQVEGPGSQAERALSPSSPPAYFVGRATELQRLQAAVAQVRRGERQAIFLSGEPGIGKTTVVDHFLAQLSAPEALFVARGQCIERYGASEAYLPLLEALGQVCHSAQGAPVLEVLRRYAPSWLAQFPALVSVEERGVLPHPSHSDSRERMLRQLAEALEALTVEAVLVLVVEDLQWSDPSTLEVLAYLARRRSPAQLLLLGTYRPVDVVMSEHPVRQIIQGLHGQRQCEELALELLTLEEVTDYLRRRLGERTDLGPLSEGLYQRSEGNALFLASFVDALLVGAEAGGQAAVADLPLLPPQIPMNLRQMVLRQVEGLPEAEQELLKVASVEGRGFTVAGVAGVSGRPVEEVEDMFDALARRGQLIREVGLSEWREGIVTVQYEFRHALQQEVVYAQLGQGRRVRLHRQLGEWQEVHYGAQATLVAEELAVHFTEGREYQRAVQYHQQAGVQALRRYAPEEAVTHCTAGVELLARLPETPDRNTQELALRMTLASALSATRGLASAELEQNLQQAYVLCQGMDDPTAPRPGAHGPDPVVHESGGSGKDRSLHGAGTSASLTRCDFCRRSDAPHSDRHHRGDAWGACAWPGASRASLGAV